MPERAWEDRSLMSDASVPDRRADVRAGLADVRARIDRARAAAGRTDEVTLVVVTKSFPASDVDILASLGVQDVGENRDQEARAKRAAVAAPSALRWHMIGQLQRNKAASVAGWADVVESVDRPELVAALGRAAAAAGRRLEVLVQVCLDPVVVAGRGGADPVDVPALADAVASEPALQFKGLMGVAPYPAAGGVTSAGAAFARLQQIADALRAVHPQADRISAGMSGDLEEAVAHGATQVRIGGAVLGQRTRVQ
jgi:pyridoxal phosphate enzyme (YggS family)